MEYKIEMPDLEECIICYEETIKFMFFPCNHKVCQVCFPKLHQCPLCQTELRPIPEIEHRGESCKVCLSILVIMSFCIWCLKITHTF